MEMTQIKELLGSGNALRHSIYYNKGDGVDFEFMVLVDDGKNKLIDKILLWENNEGREYELEKLPYRLFIVTDNNETETEIKRNSFLKRRIVFLTTKEFKELFGDNNDEEKYENFKLNLYKKWIEHLSGRWNGKLESIKVYVDLHEGAKGDEWNLDLFKKLQGCLKIFARSKEKSEGEIDVAFKEVEGNTGVKNGRISPWSKFLDYLKVLNNNRKSWNKEFRETFSYLFIELNLPPVYAQQREKVDNKLQDCDSYGKCNIVILRHGLPDNDEKIYAEGISGACSHLLILSSSDRKLKEKVIENALIRMLIIDERVMDFVSGKSEDVRKRFKYANITVPYKCSGVQIAVSEKTYTCEFEKVEGSKERFNFNNDIKENKYDMLIIHQGILDKLKKNGTRIEPEEFVRSIRTEIPLVVITSGRGEPENVPKNAKFISYSILESTLVKDYHEKFILTQILMNLKNRGK